MDRPAPVRPRVLESLEDEGLLFKKRKLEWAARQTRKTEAQETVIVELSSRLPDFAWRVQEVAQLQEKFPDVYFIVSCPELTPDNCEDMCADVYYLGRLNLVWGERGVQAPGGEPEYRISYLNRRGQENYCGTDVDELYERLCDVYYPSQEPPEAEADTIFRPLGDQVLHSGLIRPIFRVSGPEESENAPGEA